ncbi:Hypothetical protein D9617_5g070330 [Elsinoe fawcettii]|nr:Hypothetical protein D9617_5g070330 [Elsinoe fawcettii]
MAAMTKKSSRGGHSSKSETWCLTIMNLPRGRDWAIVTDQCTEVLRKKIRVDIAYWSDPATTYPQKAACMTFKTYPQACRMLQHFRTHPIDNVQLELSLLYVHPEAGARVMSTTMRAQNQSQIHIMWQAFLQADNRVGSPLSTSTITPPLSPISASRSWAPSQQLVPMQSNCGPGINTSSPYNQRSYPQIVPAQYPRQAAAMSSMTMHPAMQSYPFQSVAAQSSNFPRQQTQTPGYIVELQKIVITNIGDKIPTKDLDAKLRKTGCKSWSYAKDYRTAFADYEDHDKAVAAVKKLDGATLGSRSIKARIAKEGARSNPPVRLAGDRRIIAPGVASLQVSNNTYNAGGMIMQANSIAGSDTNASYVSGADLSRGRTPAIANGSFWSH